MFDLVFEMAKVRKIKYRRGNGCWFVKHPQTGVEFVAYGSYQLCRTIGLLLVVD